MSKEISAFKKLLPDIISVSRIVFAVAGAIIGFFHSYPERDFIRWIFVGIFAFCFISDIVDGLLARRFKVCTSRGAKLDTIADVALILSVFVFTVYLLWDQFAADTLQLIIVLSAAGVIIVTKLLVTLLTLWKFGRSNSMHTILSKAMGGSLMIAAMVFIVLNEYISWLFIVAVSIVILSIIEEIALNLMDNVYNPNRKGLLFDKEPKPDASNPALMYARRKTNKRYDPNLLERMNAEKAELAAKKEEEK